MCYNLTMNIAISTVLFCSIIIALMYNSFVVNFYSLVFLVIGYLAWLTYEYTFHRFLFHFKKLPFRVKKYLSNGHKFHHRYPKIKENLSLPFGLTIPFSLVSLCFIYLLFGSEYLGWFYLGQTGGLFLYELIHYLNHHSDTEIKIFKWLRSHHNLHHSKLARYNFTVSNPLFDYLFFTKK